MIICVCHRVSDRDIAREVAHGCHSFDELQERTRAATACGACTEFAQECFEAHAGGSCIDRRGCRAKATGRLIEPPPAASNPNVMPTATPQPRRSVAQHLGIDTAA